MSHTVGHCSPSQRGYGVTEVGVTEVGVTEVGVTEVGVTEVGVCRCPGLACRVP